MIATIVYTVVGFFFFWGVLMRLARNEEAEARMRYGPDHLPISPWELLLPAVIAAICGLLWPLTLAIGVFLTILARYVNNNPKEAPRG